MKIHPLVALLCLTGTAHAELAVDDGKVSVVPATTAQPARGALMKTVEKQFGPPTTKHPTVGKPPITRWDYAGFSVFFEGDRVIDSVVTGESPPASSG
jgi:hypothetical protein